jgi:division protein CdvB (Snf7/Vps24/ESCRT-III family)
VIDLLLQNLQRDDLKKIVNSQTEILDIDAQVGAHPFLRKLTSQIIANNLTREKTQRVLIEAAGHLKKYLSPRARSMSVQQVNKAVSALVYILIARLSLVCLDHPETALQVGLEVTNAHSGEIISG